jgi:hypothetical protein
MTKKIAAGVARRNFFWFPKNQQSLTKGCETNFSVARLRRATEKLVLYFAVEPFSKALWSLIMDKKKREQRLAALSFLLTVTKRKSLGYFPCFVPRLFLLFAPHTSILYIYLFKMSTRLARNIEVFPKPFD